MRVKSDVVRGLRALFTYYEYPLALAPRQFVQAMLINDPNIARRYKSLEFAATRRFSGGSQFMASYAATKIDEPIALANSIPFNPNAEINADKRIWESVGKVSGAYNFPGEMMVSGNYEYRSGAYWQRSVLFTGGVTIPSIALNVEPLSSRQLDAIQLVDLRFEKRFRFDSAHRLAVRVNLFNAMNTNTVTGVTSRSGPTFGRPTGILPPRTLAFSASYSYYSCFHFHIATETQRREGNQAKPDSAPLCLCGS